MKKKYKFSVAVFIITMFVALLYAAFTSIVNNVPAMAEIGSMPVIIIDPGHGGIDGGAVGVSGVVEKDINLAISLMLKDMFEINGFDVIMTRTEDVSIHDDGVKGVRKQKVSDLKNRLKIVNNQPDAIFISIHQNKFESSKSKGAQMFFGPNNSGSEMLAALIQQNFAASLQPGNSREIKKAGKDLYLMYNAKCPAVLIECGFLSNAQDEQMLVQSEYQSQISFEIFGSVVQFLEANRATVKSI